MSAQMANQTTGQDTGRVADLVAEPVVDTAMPTGESGRFRRKRSIREWVLRLLLNILGLIIGQLGVSLFLLPGLGSDPYSSFAQGVAGKFGVSVGTAHISMTVVLLIILLRFTRGYVMPGTVMGTLLAGPLIDVYYWLLGEHIGVAAPFWLRLGSVFAGVLIIAVGYAMIIRSDSGISPADMLPIILSDYAHIQYRWTKMACDVTLATAGYLSGGIVGVGTVMAVFMVGPVAQRLFHPMDWLTRSFLRKFNR